MDPAEQPSAPAPDRNRVIVIFSGLAVLGLMLGVGTSQLFGPDGRPELRGATADRTVPVGPDLLPRPDLASVPSLPIDPSATLSSDAATSTPTLTGIPNYLPIPADPASEPGLDFGYLTRVINLDGTVAIQFDRASFLTGKAAKERAEGAELESDYLIENTNTALRTFHLDPQASIVAQNRLLDQPDLVSRQPLTMEQFVTNATRVLTESTTPLPVWVRHTDGLIGPVTALSEQYLP